MNNFDLKKFLIENKLTSNSNLKEVTIKAGDTVTMNGDYVKVLPQVPSSGGVLVQNLQTGNQEEVSDLSKLQTVSGDVVTKVDGQESPKKDEPVKSPQKSSIKTDDGEEIAPYEGKRDYEVDFSDWELHAYLESYGELTVEVDGGYISSGTVSLTFEELEQALTFDAYLERGMDDELTIRA